MNTRNMTYYVDGFLIGKNPASGGGFTVCTARQVWREGFKKDNFTNNEAELLAILRAAMLASDGDTILSDSQNSIAWAKSGKPKARPDLTKEAQLTRELIEHKHLIVTWIPRELNKAGIINEEEAFRFQEN